MYFWLARTVTVEHLESGDLQVHKHGKSVTYRVLAQDIHKQTHRLSIWSNKPSLGYVAYRRIGTYRSIFIVSLRDRRSRSFTPEHSPAALSRVMMVSFAPSIRVFAILATLSVVSAQQFASDWEPDTANWGSFPTVPYETWAEVQPTAEQDRLALSSVRQFTVLPTTA